MFIFKGFGTRFITGGMFVLVLVLSGRGQTAGNISGTVTDSTGGIIVNATVTLISEQDNSKRNINTNEDGRFTFSSVQPGIYTVKVEQTGFQALLRKNTVLSANESLALGEIALTTGNVNETVTIVSEGAKVETESSDLTARLTSDQIDLISTKGRDITSLLRLIPGTTNEDDVESVGSGFGTDLPFISGQRGRSTVPTVDGLNAGEPSGSNKLSMTINQDAVGEVKILRNNYAAEYGNNGGAIINIVSKGGTKDYKGSTYYFLRNEALNGNTFFNNKGALPRPLYRHNIWGFTYGGPMPVPNFGEGGPSLLQKKAFFFFSYEKPHTIQPTNPIFVTVPTALERAGDFSQSFNSSGNLIVVNDPLTGVQFPGNKVPTDRWNPSTAAFLRVFPLPNANGKTTAGTQYNYVAQKSTDVPKRSAVLRFDLRPTQNDSMYWKAQWFVSDNVGFGTSGWPSGDQNRWGINSHYLYEDNGWSANWNHVFNKSMVNEFNFGMRHDTEGFIPEDESLTKVLRSTLGYSAPQLFPTNNRLGTIPNVTNFTGALGTPALINWLARWGEAGQDYIRPSFSDNLSYNRGNHNYKFGMYYERMLNGEAAGSNWAGTLSFTNSTSNSWSTAAGNTGHPYANALLGNFQSYTENQFRPHTNIEMIMLQWYAQDQWKIKRNLSISYGVRFGYHTPYFQVDGIGSSFDPTRYSASKIAMYVPWCRNQTNGLPTGTAACATADRFAVDPRLIANGTVSAAALVNQNLVRSLLPDSDILNGLQLAKDPTTPRGYRQFRTIDTEPRIGLAWDINGKAKTVIRTMIGVYHTPRAGGGTTGDLTGNPPEQRSFTITNGNIANLEALAIQVRNNELVLPTGAIRGLESKTHTPEIYNFSLGVQQDLGFGTVVEISYVGSRARWLGEQRNINGIPDGARFVNCVTPGLLPTGVPCHAENRDPFTALSITNVTTGARNNDFLRPFLGYGDINFVTWSANSRYDSLQIQMNRRYAKGFQYGIAYTWGKSTDTTSDDRDGLVYATGSVGRDYKLFNLAGSDFDQRHVLTVNYIWDVPFMKKSGNSFVRTFLGGWQISGTTSFATGKPKDITVSYSGTTINVSPGQTCPAGSTIGALITTGTTAGLFPCVPTTDFTGGSVNALPFVSSNCKSANDGATGFDVTGTPLYLNVDCFSRPTKLGDIGNMPRNFGRRPNILNSDLAFFKNVTLNERFKIQLRWEVYNIFNHTNFSDLDGALTYGLVLQQTNPTTSAGAVQACQTAANALLGNNNVCSTVYQQTNTRFGAPVSARSPRVMQGSLRINF